MQFDIGFIIEAKTPSLLEHLRVEDSLFRALLLLGRAYDIQVGFFNAGALQLNGTSACGSAIGWNGQDYFTAEAELPPLLDNATPLGKHSMPGCPDAVLDFLSRRGVLSNVAVSKAVLSHLLMMSELSAFAIPTQTVTTLEEIAHTLQLWRHCFLKPKGGSKGRGALELRQTEQGIIYQSADGGGLLTPESWQAFRNRWADYTEYLIQPRLDFHTASGHALDFRVLVSRGGSGDWETVAIYPRIGASSVVSNVSRGGYIGDASEVLRAEFGDAAVRLEQSLNTLAQRVPALIQRVRENPICCLGIDVGIDRGSLQPYVIEANSFPGVKYHAYPLAEKRILYYRHLLGRNRQMP